MNTLRMMSGVTLLGLIAGAPASARPQALTSITSLYVRYSTIKVTVNPQGELKARIDSVDRELGAANRLGKTAEVRRLLAKGVSLLQGRPWTDVADFTASLVVRSDAVVVDPARPYTVRLEQTYTPAIELQHSLTAHATLRRRAATAPGSNQQPAWEVVKELGTLDGVSRDLRDAPFMADLDLHDVADGSYQLILEVADDTRPLGAAALGIVVHKGLDSQVLRLETEAKKAPEPVRAEILYPIDRMRNVNRGRLELRTFDADKDFAAAEAVVASLKAGKDPFAGRTGDFKRHYLLASAGEVMPYHLYVPTTYSKSRPMPLIIALHGLGATEDSFFDSYGKKLPELAEQRGYILAGALGYRVDGGYGYGLAAPPADVVARRSQEYSEQDVMQVLDQVRKQYAIDPNRIYLMGHSLGAIGTWKIAPKYPDLWAALGVFSGMGVPSTLEKVRLIPEFVVHGDADPTVNVQGSRAMVAAMKALNVDVEYIEVPGGNHTNVVEPNFAKMLDFFDAHRKGARVTPQ